MTLRGFLLVLLGPTLLGAIDPGAVASAVDLPTFRGYVNDFADQIPPREEGKLEGFLQGVDERFQIQVAIVTMPDLGGEDPTDYANRLYERWGIGDRRTNRGLLVLDAKRERFLRVEVGYGLEGALPDGRVGEIIRRDMVPLLREGRAGEAYATGSLALLVPAVQEMGEDPEQLEALFESAGYVRRTGNPGGDRDDHVALLLFLAVVVLLLVLNSRGGGRGRRYRRAGPVVFWGGGGFGGGGGGLGGFGGFGGGLSGGGGAGSSY